MNSMAQGDAGLRVLPDPLPPVAPDWLRQRQDERETWRFVPLDDDLRAHLAHARHRRAQALARGRGTTSPLARAQAVHAARSWHAIVIGTLWQMAVLDIRERSA